MIGVSIIIPVYNDHASFSKTLCSLKLELKSEDEIVVVDSSLDKNLVKNHLDNKSLISKIKYLWVAPEGIYSAQNKGISAATNNWVIVINSGDLLELGARRLITDSVLKFPKINIHVFSQLSIYKDQVLYKYTPKKNNIWPHQSIVCSKCVYKELGNYSLKYKLISDQIFFLNAREKYQYIIYDDILTLYDLQGVSSNINLGSMKEYYILNIFFGHSFVVSFYKSYIVPLIKLILIFSIGERKMHTLKSTISRNYADY
jgi:glycosyltransferase involved in cell wall biosynthesis